MISSPPENKAWIHWIDVASATYGSAVGAVTLTGLGTAIKEFAEWLSGDSFILML